MQKEESRFAENNIFEGMVSIRSLIYAYDNKISDRRITKVYYDPQKAKKRAKELSYIKARSYDIGYDIHEMPEEKICSLTSGNSHGGLICEATKRTLPLLTNNLHFEKNGFYVMLDGIEDPYNFGYAIRSLYAAGANGIILTPRNWLNCAGVVCRASAGASEQIKMFVSSSDEAADIFKNAGYSVIAADKENSISVYDTKLNYPIFLIVGGEKRGITNQTLEKADKIVHLDYGRDFPKALSAASAASVLAFEIMRQNRNNQE